MALLPIWGDDPICPIGDRPHMKLRSQTKSLAGQVVAVNVLLVVATLFAASAASKTSRTRGQSSDGADMAGTRRF